MKTSVSAIFLCTLLFWAGSSTAVAQYNFDVLNTVNGLPQNSVHAILQTRDGYLWFTTFDGLVRYNGERFEVFNRTNSKGINSNRFLALYEDTDGALWAGTEDGGVTRYAGGAFKTYDTRDGLPENFVIDVRRTGDGELLVATPAGLARMTGERFEVVCADRNSLDYDLGTPGNNGEIWSRVGTRLRRLSNGKTTLYTVPDGGPSFVLFNQVYADRQGRLWIATNSRYTGGELWVLKNEAMTRYSAADGVPPFAIISFCEDHEGAMWFGTDGGGLVRFNDGKFTTYTTAHGLSSNSIEHIFADREGTLWIGTRDNGITRITRRIITTISERDGLRGKIFYPILEDRSGSVWVGYDGVNRIKDGKFTYYPLNFRQAGGGPVQPPVQSLFEDRDGRLWIGCTSGFARFNGEALIPDESLPHQGGPYAIFQDSRGAFWIGCASWLARSFNGEIRTFTRDDGLQDFVQPIYEDRQGRIWIGSYGGLAQFVDDRLVFLTEKDGLSSNRIRAIYEDTDGTLWIGTYDGGLNRFKDGRFTSYTTKQGMFSNGVFAILEDKRGNFWMSSNQGIHRVRKDQLNDFAEGRIHKIDSISYGKADGMLNVECNGARQPSAIKTRDGRMWFPTFDGIAVVDSDAVTFNNVPPPVVIERVVLERQNMDPGRPIELHPGQDDLEIHYAGLSFINSEHVQFKYRLEGLDEEWVEPGNRRVAYYPHLPDGKYIFQVIAANSDGVWNTQGARIEIKVLPAFWRTWWFMAIVAATISGAAIAVYRSRVNKLEHARAVQQEFSRQLINSQETERKRIGSELHDSLGQSIIIIRNLCLMMRGRPQDQNEVDRQIDEIVTETSRALGEVKEISYNLRPFHLDRLGLTRALESLVDKVSKSVSVDFFADIDDVRGCFTQEEETSLYRIAQETLNNIVKHAGATRASVTLRRGERQVELIVRDNGQGLSRSGEQRNSQGTGFGLIGIAERVRMLGGALEIESEPGRGTTITVTIALKDRKDE